MVRATKLFHKLNLNIIPINLTKYTLLKYQSSKSTQINIRYLIFMEYEMMLRNFIQIYTVPHFNRNLKTFAVYLFFKLTGTFLGNTIRSKAYSFVTPPRNRNVVFGSLLFCFFAVANNTLCISKHHSKMMY